MSDLCHCCGGPADTRRGVLRYCHLCRSGCTLVEKDRILRGPSCPFVAVVPSNEMVTRMRTGFYIAPREEDFWWRGRMRRNVPGG